MKICCTLFLVVLCFASYPAQADPALVVHLVPASFAGCSTIDASELTCEEIVIEGDNSGYQMAFILASGVAEISGVQFGITYGSEVEVLNWVLCTGGQEIPEEGWPESGTAVAATWPETESTSPPDNLVVVGYFTISPGSTGVTTVTEDGRISSAVYVDGEGEQQSFIALGAGDVAGDEGGIASCGAESESSESGGEVQLVPLQSSELPEAREQGVGHFAWSPDSQRLALGCLTGTYCYSLRDGTLTQLITTTPAELCWSADGTRITAVIREALPSREEQVTLLDINVESRERTTRFTEATQSRRLVHPQWTADGVLLARPPGARWRTYEGGPVRSAVFFDDWDPSTGKARRAVFRGTPNGEDLDISLVPFPTDPPVAWWRLIDTTPQGIFVSAMIAGLGVNKLLVSEEGRVIRDYGAAVDISDVSPDGSYAVGYNLSETETSSGLEHASDLFLLRLSDGQLVQLTNTPDRPELMPIVSPDGSKIAYHDDRTLYVARLEWTR